MSKRVILSICATVYETTGFITPITIVFKIISQMVCRRKVEWDTRVPDEVQKIWMNLVSGLSNVGVIRVKRFSFYEVSHDIINVGVHAFADSSKQAYACVNYICVHKVRNQSVLRGIDRNQKLLQ